MVNSVFVNTEGLYQRRRAYNMSYRNDYTCNLGEIVPVYWQDLMPNSSWSCAAHGLIRFQPLIAPIMDNIDFYLHFWQAPRRIIDGEEFTKMITGEYDVDDWPGVYFCPSNIFQQLELLVGEQSLSDEVIGYLLRDGSIFDMFGYDRTLMSDDNQGKLNARKFIMYFRLLSNWYTNENIEPYDGFFDNVEMFDKLDFMSYESDHQLGEGDISDAIATIIFGFYVEYGTAGFAPHLWPKDYYTSALPTLQYGLPTYLPLGESAPVTGKIDTNQTVTLFGPSPNGIEMIVNGFNERNTEDGLAYLSSNDPSRGQFIVSDQQEVVNGLTGKLRAGAGSSATDPITVSGQVDLSEATAITINELRVANALQVFKEREMRFGRKAPEYYKGFYGVSPGDLRLQLPKFLGGGRLPVNISDIEQTSASQEGSPQGKLAGKGTAIAAGFARAKTFTAEEALVLGVAWLMPKITYARTLSRFDTKLNDRFAYYNPSFAHIGEQEVYNYEIFAGSYGFAIGNEEFGYQPRYTEYRFHANEMHGEFKDTLSFWTLGRIYEAQPALNRQFVYMQPRSMQRIFVAEFDSNDFMVRNVLCSLKFSCAVLQPLSRYGTPGLLA